MVELHGWEDYLVIAKVFDLVFIFFFKFNLVHLIPLLVKVLINFVYTQHPLLMHLLQNTNYVLFFLYCRVHKTEGIME